MPRNRVEERWTNKYVSCGKCKMGVVLDVVLGIVYDCEYSPIMMKNMLEKRLFVQNIPL